MFEYLPLSQAVQPRLDVSVAGSVWNSPGMQFVCCKHELRPELGWYLFGSQAVHASALMRFEYVPAGQFWHWRSAIWVPRSVSYSPSRHTVLFRHALWPDLLWYWFTAQELHGSSPAALNSPGEQSSHWRSKVSVPSNFTCWPGLHERFLRHDVLLWLG